MGGPQRSSLQGRLRPWWLGGDFRGWLTWQFEPEQTSIELSVGEVATVDYLEGVEMLDRLGVAFHKIGAWDATYKQLIEKGISSTIDGLLRDIRERDARDSNRAAAPLRVAADAVVLDTTDLTIDAAIASVVRQYRALAAAER